MRRIGFLFLLTGLFGGRAEASYRVYQLLVTEYNPAGRELFTRLELSTLDHTQWEFVHASYRSARVRLVDTWYCPGDTSRRSYCPKPKGVKTRGPASTLDTRVGLPIGRQPVIP